MAAEMCLLQLPALLNGDPEAEFRPSPFFAEQLTAFELWLAHGSAMKQPPEQLPIVLQASLVPCMEFVLCHLSWDQCCLSNTAMQSNCIRPSQQKFTYLWESCQYTHSFWEVVIIRSGSGGQDRLGMCSDLCGL